MSNKPFFSAVIPLYNKAPHVARSVGSVLNQTFGDFELIIVDDSSTDGSLNEVQKFNDPRIRLLHREKPGPGGYAARNFGIKVAKGQWIAFLDADDEWYPNHLEKAYELSFKFPEVYFMGSGWQSQNNGIKKVDAFFKEFNSNKKMIIETDDFLKYCSLEMQPVCGSAVFIKKSSPIASELFPANSEVKRGGDRYAWLKLICFHKKMAWSSHLGAIYHVDSINMVTKTARSSMNLLDNKVLQSLSRDLNKKEQLLLKQYFNQRILSGWLNNKILKNRNYNVYRHLHGNNFLKFFLIFRFIVKIIYIKLNSIID
ncbi:glycosyl transferase [Desulfosarcina ovata subsp. sediminis]|uniref:Glycosyl transferase n=1 Tax=Desulfosarcina ovata subsp. sediminis TaxID=885957 RepID=A0A5K7ZR00_9BACT|nr:glycosyltransferase family 2 protein [Desulfosarcina ovata]BBO80263.1 glycosyl transferase [Desulfosarcina ovata subsp. sediminis]